MSLSDMYNSKFTTAGDFSKYVFTCCACLSIISTYNWKTSIISTYNWKTWIISTYNWKTSIISTYNWKTCITSAHRKLISQDVYELKLRVPRNYTYNRGLISLDMYGCRIGDVGARVIGAFFSFFLETSLDMYGCHIGDVGGPCNSCFCFLFFWKYL